MGFMYLALDIETGAIIWEQRDLSNLDNYMEMTSEDIFWET